VCVSVIIFDTRVPTSIRWLLAHAEMLSNRSAFYWEPTESCGQSLLSGSESTRWINHLGRVAPTTTVDSVHQFVYDTARHMAYEHVWIGRSRMHRLRVPVSMYTSINWDLLHLLSSTLRFMLIARLVQESYKSVYIGHSDGRFTLKIILTVLKLLSKWNFGTPLYLRWTLKTAAPIPEFCCCQCSSHLMWP